MSVIAPSKRVNEARPGRQRMPVSIVVLSALLGTLVVGTFAAATAMIANPLEPLGMTTVWLEKAPVDTYFWPDVLPWDNPGHAADFGRPHVPLALEVGSWHRIPYWPQE